MGEKLDAVYAEADRGIDEFGILTGDDNVTGPDQHQAAGNASPLHCGNGRLRDIPPALAEADVDFFFPAICASAPAQVKPHQVPTVSYSSIFWYGFCSRKSWPEEK